MGEPSARSLEKSNFAQPRRGAEATFLKFPAGRAVPAAKHVRAPGAGGKEEEGSPSAGNLRSQPILGESRVRDSSIRSGNGRTS